MQLIQDLAKITPNGDVVLTIGVFDGVHLGHQHLIGKVVQRAKELGCWSGVITFHPHPLAVLRPDLALPMLTTPEERLALIRRLNVNVIATLPFTPELAQLSAVDFVALIRQHLRLRELWVGPDFALGRGREGTIARLQELGQEMGFTVQIVPPLMMRGEVVSSTSIRDLLSAGDVAQAAQLLGHCFAFSGPVIHGAERGRKLGFPTANLAAAPGRALPCDGIYAGHVFVSSRFQASPRGGSARRVPGSKLPEAGPERETWNVKPGTPRPAVVNVGTRPTFDHGARLVEAYILDFDGDLYGQTLTVHFVQRLRGELRFANVSELVTQIGQDAVQARKILTSDMGCAMMYTKTLQSTQTPTN